MTLEQALRAATGSVTLVPVSAGWQASVQQDRSNRFRVRIDRDPVHALLQALGVEPVPAPPSIFD